MTDIKIFENKLKEDLTVIEKEVDYGSVEIGNLVTSAKIALKSIIDKRNSKSNPIVQQQMIANYKKACNNILKINETKETRRPLESLETLIKTVTDSINTIETLGNNANFAYKPSPAGVTSTNRDIVEDYLIGGKIRVAYFIINKPEEKDGEESEISKKLDNNEKEMRDIVGKCGFKIKTATNFNSISEDVNRSESYQDYLIYYAGAAQVENNQLMLTFNNSRRSTSLNSIVEKFKEKEDLIKTEHKKKLSLKLMKKDSAELSFFTFEFKKLFIFDIINQGSISDLITFNKPIFPSFKDAIYLYSNIPVEINKIFKDDQTTIFTKSLIDRISIDMSKGEGRNLSTISKVIQYDVANKLKIIKPSTQYEINFENKYNDVQQPDISSFSDLSIQEKDKQQQQSNNNNNNEILEKEIKNVIDLFGTSITESVFAKILLNSYRIIHGDASNSDFLIYDNFHAPRIN